MPTSCFRTRSSSQSIWSCLVFATLAVCGIVLYVSFIYRGNVNISCENCDKNMDIQPEKFTQEICPNVCSSKECVFAANFLLENMDLNVDPCEDFYSFSCGRLVQTFSKQDNYSTVDGMELRLKTTLKIILDKLKGPPGSRSEKLKMVYDSCMSDDSSEVKSIRSVKEFLKQIGIEGWPNLSSTFEFPEFSLERTLGRLSAFNEFAFVRFNPAIHEHEEDSTNELFNMTVSFANPLMRDDSESGLYEKIILKILKNFGVNNQHANKTWEDFRRIDADVLKLYVDSTHMEDPENEEPLKYLNCTSEIFTNEVPLCCTLRHFIEYSEIGQLFSKDHAYIRSPLFVENIIPRMKKFTASEVANYLALRFVLSHLDVMGSVFRSILLSHPDAYPLQTEYKLSTIKWKHCVGWISYFMPHALAQEYVASEFSDGQLEEMHTIVRIYLQEAKNYISEQKWIDESAKTQIKSGIQNMAYGMENFVNVLAHNNTKLNLLIQYFKPKNQSFLHNIVEYRKNVLKLYLLNYKAMQSLEFPLNFFAVNAYHSSGSLDIGVGMFLPPVYQHGLPKLLNLATMGTTIGHELGHEIALFLGYSEDLNEEVKKMYADKKKCLDGQYFEYEVEKIGKKVNGNQTSNENMADLIGIEITQRVIDKYSQEGIGNRNFALPALDFSSKQLLYVSLAQLWFNVRSKEKEQKHFDEDVHAPPHIRITGMLRNLPEFSDVFNCEPGSNMNPLHRCSIRD